jgi:hypothetical protein
MGVVQAELVHARWAMLGVAGILAQVPPQHPPDLNPPDNLRFVASQ